MIRLAALLLTVLTGFAGLVYEVAWQKYLAALLGSHGEATAAVLAIFLGGLSLGYALFGRVSRQLVERSRLRSRPARLLFFYAIVEAGIGLYAWLFPSLFGVFQRISLFVPHGNEGLGFAFDVGLSALLIGPPTVLMGGTIPILTLALAGDLKHATRIHAWVYGFNTAGAFVGALAGGFFLVPMLGLDGVVYAMGCVNLVAAAIFAQLDRHAGSIELDLKAPPAVEPVARFAAWASVSALAGFAMMALQTTFNRVGALAFGASQFTFASIVAVFVACIALGSLAVSAIGNIPRGLVVGSPAIRLSTPIICSTSKRCFSCCSFRSASRGPCFRCSFTGCGAKCASWDPSPVSSTRGTPSALSSGHCLAAICCSSGSTFTTSIGSPWWHSRWALRS